MKELENQCQREIIGPENPLIALPERQKDLDMLAQLCLQSGGLFVLVNGQGPEKGSEGLGRKDLLTALRKKLEPSSLFATAEIGPGYIDDIRIPSSPRQEPLRVVITLPSCIFSLLPLESDNLVYKIANSLRHHLSLEDFSLSVPSRAFFIATSYSLSPEEQQEQSFVNSLSSQLSRHLRTLDFPLSPLSPSSAEKYAKMLGASPQKARQIAAASQNPGVIKALVENDNPQQALEAVLTQRLSRVIGSHQQQQEDLATLRHVLPLLAFCPFVFTDLLHLFLPETGRQNPVHLTRDWWKAGIISGFLPDICGSRIKPVVLELTRMVTPQSPFKENPEAFEKTIGLFQEFIDETEYPSVKDRWEKYKEQFLAMNK